MRLFPILSILFLFALPSPALAATSLSVPFTPQAPFADWREPWQNACEETAVVMIDAYYGNRTLDAERARSEILHVFAIKNKMVGWSLDENAQTIVSLINNFFPWEAHIVHEPSIDDIRHEIDAKRPVLLPVYGKALHNPFFRQGGPYYHTIVISGYDDATQEFIVQEPGTRHGLDFRYSYATILDAMHDFVPGRRTAQGQKVAIFTRQEVQASRQNDGDNDGLTKEQELAHGTALWSKDTDNDGFTDKQEVESGYSPTVAEHTLRFGTLIKIQDSPKVYRLEGNTKRHIVSEQIFLKNGWRWSDIITLSDTFINTLKEGQEIS